LGAVATNGRFSDGSVTVSVTKRAEIPISSRSRPSRGFVT
jgi:hypothetical protein